MERFMLRHFEYPKGTLDAKKRIFKKVETEKNIWYISTDENSADNLYVYIKNENPNRYFRGFGGATLNFALDDGSSDDVVGPWHSNSDALLSDTGIDIRDKSMTIGVIGRGRSFGENGENYIDEVLYKDDDWVIGPFKRIADLAESMAESLGEKIWYYSQSLGGSITGWAEPTNVMVPEDTPTKNLTE